MIALSTFRRKAAAVAVAAALGLSVGVAAVAAASSDPTPPPGFEYVRNANGDTIGPWVGGEGAYQPDLVEMVADNGLHGYSRTSDMTWAPATTPEEAVQITREHVNEQGLVVIPVYEFDGTTQIGEAAIAEVHEGAPADDE